MVDIDVLLSVYAAGCLPEEQSVMRVYEKVLLLLLLLLLQEPRLHRNDQMRVSFRVVESES